MTMPPAALPRVRAIAALLLPLSLAACGAGAGGGVSPAPPVAVTPAPTPAQPSRLHPVVIAGVATQNNGGDFADGSAGNARFSGITGLALDKAGNIYVADAGNCAVRKVTPAGMVSTLAGTGHCETWDDTTVPADGLGLQARFYQLGRISADADGKLYVNDRAEIRRITPGGSVSTLAGIFRPVDPAVDGSGAGARFQGILDLAMAPNGTLTVVDYTHNAGLDHFLQPLCTVPNGYNTLREVSPQGVVTTVPGSSADCDAAKAAAPLTQAGAVRFDKTGTLWFLHLQTLAKRPAGGTAVIVKDASGQPVVGSLPQGGMEIAPDDAGNLYYRIGTTITKLDAGGTRLDVVSSQAGAAADINPDMALDGMSNLTYVGGHDFLVSVNNQIVKLTLK
jgi:hypothetical protein